MKLAKALTQKKKATKNAHFGFRVEREIISFLRKHGVDIADLCRFAMLWKMNELKKEKS